MYIARGIIVAQAKCLWASLISPLKLSAEKEQIRAIKADSQAEVFLFNFGLLAWLVSVPSSSDADERRKIQRRLASWHWEFVIRSPT